MVSFRRSAASGKERKTAFRAIAMTIGLVLLVFFLKIIFDQFLSTTLKYQIRVEYVDENTFVINEDTTNYDDFASDLMTAVRSARTSAKAKQERPSIEIEMWLPQGKTLADVHDILQVANATDIKLILKTK